MKRHDPKNILIINLKFLGDLIVTTAAIRAIKEKYSSSKITVLVRKQYKDVLAGNKNIDEIIFYDLSNKEKRGLSKLKREIKFVCFLRSKRFDSVVSFQAGDRYVLWSFLSGAKFRVGPIENNLAFLLTHKANVYENRNSFMDYYLEIAKTFGTEANSRQTDFVMNNDYCKCVDDFFSEKNIIESDQIICIHPGAGESSRKWKLDNYPLLVNKIFEQTDYKIIFTIGPQELKHKTFFEPLINPRVLIHYSENVHELARVISEADLLIGMDSGARHLAAALNIPSLSFFPEDLIEAWWFYEEANKQFYLSGKRNIVDKENQFLDCISAEMVFEKAIQILKTK